MQQSSQIQDIPRPVLTIVTATYNLIQSGREKRFRQCVESVHQQTCIQKIEHIVVDGASSDGTAELLKEFEDQGYFRVISKKDSGVYDAMNNGLQAASGEYILFLNSDDFLFNEDGLEKAIDELIKSRADYCFGDVNALYDDDTFCTIWYGSIDELVKTKVLRDHGGFDLQYKVSSDSEIMLWLYYNQNPYIHSSAMFACYRLGGLSTVRETVSQKDHSAIFYKYFGCSAGLTLQQCIDIWNYSGISKMSNEEYMNILIRLPVYEWRKKLFEAWEKKHSLRHKLLLERVFAKWKKAGARGVLKACIVHLKRMLYL